MTGPLGIYGTALRDAAAGRDGVMHIVDEAGGCIRIVDPTEWTSEIRPGDASLLERCEGRTLDVGCGPGRLTAALARAGHSALGIDISAEAVRQALRRGAPAIRADVFGPLPNEGHWNSIMLADGNVGIGGAPAMLLKRCVQLLGPRGSVLVEVGAQGGRTWTGHVRLRHAHRQSAPFPWAAVSADDIAAVAGVAGLWLREAWMEDDRWFAHLAR